MVSPFGLPYGETMVDGISGDQAVDRALRLLSALVTSGGATPLSQVARELCLPVSTAHRLAARLVAHGLVTRPARGRYRGGAALARHASRIVPGDLLADVARAPLRLLAARTGRTAHLGIFEADMVTYLVREPPPAGGVFTRETMQLEAYCSAIGKVLLARQPEATLARYLSDGGFVALTDNTITEPEQLRAQLAATAASGHGVDDEEVEKGLFCLAVSLPTSAGLPEAALSLAGAVPGRAERLNLLDALKTTANGIALSFV